MIHKKIKHLLDSSDNPQSIGSMFRSRRFFVFEKLIEQNFNRGSCIKILDVGGEEHFWKDKAFLDKFQVEITLLNLEAKDVDHPNLKAIKGNATDLSEFETDTFDLVFSNSVIEHLYTFENQRKMANECMRVGKKFFIQTPNKYFPIEAHYALPFGQFLPRRLMFFLLTKTKISRMHRWDQGFAKQYLEEIRLLSLADYKSLFPNATIYKEKFLGLSKSFVAHNL
ncbi:methyltransferase domain-containing protein [Belliella kenyensis]|uniref:Methyltransferase domain-containing protein n=1 Tax=Belliella kenyensis TaxID=1472724 RepID=A0ABV8EMK0_9BACT|nr:class I SAM-dependent methyltransferase [Belliella kenyensis]MCH7401598.1 class I SAM-dependent methyltransferase [Belliella kenyensis]MDN3603122.1 methyltransferase domain-containing protein [Belliella kenyensis]